MYPLQKEEEEEERIQVRRVDLEMERRFSHTSHVINNHLFLVGGVGVRQSPGKHLRVIQWAHVKLIPEIFIFKHL